MFTPTVQFQQSIQNIQFKVHQDIREAKGKIANPGAIQSEHFKELNKTVETIDSACKQILLLLSSHDISQPDCFSPAEKFKLQLLNAKVTQHKEFFEKMLSKIMPETRARSDFFIFF